MLVSGQDPGEAKQQEKRERQAAALNTFESIARRWHTDNLHRWKENHAARVISDFEKDVFPAIGEIQITEISVSDVKAVISAIIARGATVTAEKVRQWIGAVYQYAAMLEITDRNPAAVLRGHFEQAKTDHRPALPREELTEFFRRLILAEIEPQNRIALILNMLTFLRSTELRGGQWNEIDFDAAMWTVPAQRMKHEKTAPKPPHAVPLADWTLELLAELKEITGNTPFLFPSRTKTDGFISDATISRIIERMGYKPHSARPAITKPTLGQLRKSLGRDFEAWWQEQFGYDFSELTESEARYINKQITRSGVDAVRDTIIARRLETVGHSSP